MERKGKTEEELKKAGLIAGEKIGVCLIISQ